VPRLVKFSDGTEAELHFRQLPASEFNDWREAERSEDPERRRYALQMLIGASLCDDAGNLALSTKEARLLSMQGVNALAPHVFEVCGISTTAKKDSPSAAGTTSATS
jgi:hypothetical protein